MVRGGGSPFPTGQVRVLHEAKANLNNLLTDIGRSPLIGCTTMAATDTVQARSNPKFWLAGFRVVCPKSGPTNKKIQYWDRRRQYCFGT